MSFDLVAFDPHSAPRTKKAFLDWDQRCQDENQHLTPSDDPGSLTPALQAWFTEMIQSFPPLNGPLSDIKNVDNPTTTDYALDRTRVHACFRWSQAEAAYIHAMTLAEKHRVGMYNISSNEFDAWFPDASGNLQRIV